MAAFSTLQRSTKLFEILHTYSKQYLISPYHIILIILGIYFKIFLIR